MSLASLAQVEPHTIDVAALRAALVAAVAGEVRFDRLDRALYSTDASVFQIVPLGVVLPKTQDDIMATLKTCARAGVSVLALESGRTLLLEREACEGLANKNKLSLTTIG